MDPADRAAQDAGAEDQARVSLQYLKLPRPMGEVEALAGCKSVSIAPVTHAGEAQLAALCEK